MRVAVVDIGTNSTRLLVADVAADGAVTELERRSTVTRLGQGVDTSGTLAPAAMDRVFAALATYREVADELEVEATTGVLTSAVRDATNGADFQAEIRARFGFEVSTITGDREAQLTFLGATSERDPAGRLGEPAAPIVVIDIGGGSTEFVVGEGGAVGFHVSTQVGVVRQTERHIAHDPPHHDELEAMADEVRAVFRDALPTEVRKDVGWAIAVAGTATSAAAMLLELDPYDATKVHGHVVYRAEVEMLLARLAEMTEDQRRAMPGLQPDRAPTIVAGMLVLAEAMRVFDLDQAEVSEHDILRGAALVRAGIA
jgi:exopolyphosphatase/guanosine-5'-triphosphate,3'-diphosphate pyrophosphatase